MITGTNTVPALCKISKNVFPCSSEPLTPDSCDNSRVGKFLLKVVIGINRFLPK